MTLFNAPPAFTRAMKLEAIERELKYRKHVYGRRVADKKMSQALADKQIAIFEAIAADYAPEVWAKLEEINELVANIAAPNKCQVCGCDFPKSTQPVQCADCEDWYGNEE